ncbi:phage tail protein [Curvivirga sp.]|uniref:phage tail protein n=1 Tax=Curvivirga sp. TaxID=2856848 RepID=UPI003B5AEA7C
MTLENLDCTTNPGQVVDMELVDKTYVDHALACLKQSLLEKIVPAGSIFWFAADAVPSGYLSCNGGEISRETYSNLFSVIGETFGAGDGVSTFDLPDLRGEFIRGWDDDRGVDTGRGFATSQSDAVDPSSLKILRNGTDIGTTSGRSQQKENGASYPSYNGRYNDNYTIGGGSSETRPRNIALLPCIKY